MSKNKLTRAQATRQRALSPLWYRIYQGIVRPVTLAEVLAETRAWAIALALVFSAGMVQGAAVEARLSQSLNVLKLAGISLDVPVWQYWLSGALFALAVWLVLTLCALGYLRLVDTRPALVNIAVAYSLPFLPSLVHIVLLLVVAYEPRQFADLDTIYRVIAFFWTVYLLYSSTRSVQPHRGTAILITITLGLTLFVLLTIVGIILFVVSLRSFTAPL